jgi:DNA-binding CsgD family transcriptional regulator
VIDAVGSTLPGHVVNAKGERLLTAREDQTVSLVAEGMGNRDIADQLGIKENTVKKSLMRIYDKLGMSNRVELVLYALTHRGIEQAVTSATPLAVAKPLTVDATEVSQQHLLVDT